MNLEPLFHRKLILFVAKNVQKTVSSFEARQGVSRYCSFKSASTSGDPQAPEHNAYTNQLMQSAATPSSPTTAHSAVHSLHHNRRIYSQRFHPPRPPPHVRLRIRILHALAILLKESMHRLILPVFLPSFPPISLIRPFNLLNPISLMNMPKDVHQRLRPTQSTEEMRAPYAAIRTTV